MRKWVRHVAGLMLIGVAYRDPSYAAAAEPYAEPAGSATIALRMPSSAPEFPVVSFEYGGLIDKFCADALRQPVLGSAADELQQRIPELEETWRKEGPPLLREVPAITGVPFRFAETKAALITCNAPSMSLPLMINTRPYLKATATQPVAPTGTFANTVFHELLHRYVGDILNTLPDRTTALLQKYASEPAAVRNHLHLFALEHLAYQRLGRERDLEPVIALQATLKSRDILARARQIVAIETPERFARELRGN